jgi:CubicO group peptidase (beta-lactamase class C family)
MLRSLSALMLGAFFALATPLQAQTLGSTSSPSDAVDALVTAQMADRHIPGVALAVVRGGKVIKAVGYGFADLEHEVPVTPETVFKIGSVSKQFIATGIMLLAQDGKLSVDDPVAMFFPNAPESWRPITIRHFLTHTSGVQREGPAFDAQKIQPDSIVVSSTFDRPLEFPTGLKYQYCNVCYFALADIIAKVSGQPWDAYLEERVFRPLGMTATRATTTTAIVPHRARGYSWSDGRYENALELVAVRPSGAFLSSALDLARWEAALNEETILTKASREQMYAPTRLLDGGTSPYGFGWDLTPLVGHRRIHHGGSLPGFRAEMARFPDDDLTVIVLTNADNGQPEQIANVVASMYFAAP